MTISDIKKYQHAELGAQYLKGRAKNHAFSAHAELVKGLDMGKDGGFYAEIVSENDHTLKLALDFYKGQYERALKSTDFGELFSIYVPLLKDYLTPEQVTRMQTYFGNYKSKKLMDYESAQYTLAGEAHGKKASDDEIKKAQEIVDSLGRVSGITQALEGMRLETIKVGIDREGNKRNLEEIVRSI